VIFSAGTPYLPMMSLTLVATESGLPSEKVARLVEVGRCAPE